MLKNYEGVKSALSDFKKFRDGLGYKKGCSFSIGVEVNKNVLDVIIEALEHEVKQIEDREIVL